MTRKQQVIRDLAMALALVLMVFVPAGISLLAQTPRGSGTASEGGTLSITVSGARNATGKIAIALFQHAGGFPEDASTAIRQQEVAIEAGTMSARIVFSDLLPGIYAVAVRHDENMNGSLDKNFLGIPKEGYGASNNPKARLRAPTFDEAKFELTASQAVDIRLIY
jgi:uncharacterized protein (DUF2141 family)